MEYKSEQFDISDDLVFGDFVAIDFETIHVESEEFFGEVEKYNAPCQVGIAVVESGNVNLEKSFKINLKPIGIDENFNIDPSSITRLVQNTDIISQKDYKKFNASEVFGKYPTIKQVWKDIISAIAAKPIIAHNALTVSSIILDVINFYKLSLATSLKFHCTMNASISLDNKYFGDVPSEPNMHTLTTCCKRYNVPFSEDKHHDALENAVAAAELMIKMRSQVKPLSFEQIANNDDNYSLTEEEGKADSEQKNPFDGRRVAPIGLFDFSDVKGKLISMGAVTYANGTKKAGKLNDDISGNTHYVIIGKCPNDNKIEKLRKVQYRGYDVRVLDEQDLINIINGKYDGYWVHNEVKKNLTFTLEHYNNNHLKINAEQNPVLEDNIYVPDNISGNKNVLAQIIGNIGAYANYEIENASESDKTLPIIMLADKTIKDLEQGYRDENIQYIEQTYNKSDAKQLIYQFVSESELITWIRNHCLAVQDKLTLNLLDLYNSKHS